MIERNRLALMFQELALVVGQSEIADVGTKHFKPLRVGPAREPITPLVFLNPLAEAIQLLAAADPKNDGTTPFMPVAQDLAGLVEQAPLTAEAFADADSWVESVSEILERVSADIDGGQWGLRSRFSALRAAIAQFKTGIKTARERWKPEDEEGATTLIIPVAGQAPAVDRYILSVGAEVARNRPVPEATDRTPHDPKSGGLVGLLELLGAPPDLLEAMARGVRIKVVGQPEVLPLVDLRTSRPEGDGHVPDVLAKLWTNITFLKEGIENIGDPEFAAAATSLERLLDDADDRGLLTVLRQAPSVAVLRQVVTDVADDLKSGHASVPGSAAAALQTRATEILGAIGDIAGAEDVDIRFIVIVLAGPADQRTAAQQRLWAALALPSFNGKDEKLAGEITSRANGDLVPAGSLNDR